MFLQGYLTKVEPQERAQGNFYRELQAAGCKSEFQFAGLYQMGLPAGKNAIRNLTFHQQAGGLLKINKEGATKFMWDAVD